MAHASVPRPTDAELEILAVLWQRGPSTVRQVHATLAPQRGTRYTTVLKLLQIMLAKRLVTRDVSARSHVFAAAVGREQTQRRLVSELMDKAFAGSAAQLVLHALSSRRATPQELADVQRLLDEHLSRAREEAP